MQITANQTIAGYPSMKVRDFLWASQLTGIVNETAQARLALNSKAARDFLNQLAVLGFIKERSPHNEHSFFELTNYGLNLAYASAAKPIHRKTAERILTEFLERVERVNATPEYVYRVDTAILYGSMLSDAERLGNVNVAVNLESKAKGETEFQEWSKARRHAARVTGRSFSTIVEKAFWPRAEIYLQLKARSISLKLSELSHVELLKSLSYRVLLGDPERIAALFPTGRAA
jgi:hypothetical protein